MADKAARKLKLKVLWVVDSKEELEALPDGEYEIVWTTRKITVKGRKVVYQDTYPMQLRKVESGG